MSYQIDRHLLSLLLSERLPDPDWDSFSPADWNAIVDLARLQGVAPLLYWMMSRTARIELLPEALQASLRAMYVSTRMNNEQILQELGYLAELFHAAEIPVVALKGACFVLTIYPDIGLRPMVDLDLLVPAARIDVASEIAKKRGYVEPVPEAFPGLRDLLLHSVDFHKETAPYTALELHYSLVAEKSFAYAAPVDWFWTQTEPLPVSIGQPGLEQLRMLTPTAQVLYASAHALLKHGLRNTSLRWFCDLDCLIRFYGDQKRIDWDLLLSQARKFAWSSALHAALWEIITLFDTPVPSALMAELSTISDKNVELITTYQTQPATHTIEEYQKLGTLDWRARIRMVLGLIVPGPAYMRWRYGLRSSWALPLYYVYRWWGILRDAIKTLWLIVQKCLVRTSQARQPLDRSPQKSQ